MYTKERKGILIGRRSGENAKEGKDVDELIFIGYEFLVQIIPVTLLLIVQKAGNKKRGAKDSRWHYLFLFAFSVYIMATFYFTGAGTFFELQRAEYAIDFVKVNFSPFSLGINTRGYLLNILLFVPLGFLLPMIWPKSNKFSSVLLYGVFFSLLIEASQLINFRQPDIDDLILNTLGALVGYVVFRLFARIVRWKNGRDHYNRFEPAFYIAVIFVGRFFLFYPLVLMHILYGY